MMPSYPNRREHTAHLIKAARIKYHDTWFASSLEADWAATFDYLGWYWQYEPELLQLPDGTWYRQNSSNWQFVAFHFGQNGDKPTQAAFRY